MRSRSARIAIAAAGLALLAAPLTPVAHAAVAAPTSITAAAPAKDPVVPKGYKDVFDAARARYLKQYTAELARLNAAGAKARTAALVAERARMNAGASLNAAIALEKEWKKRNPGDPLPDAYTPRVSAAQAAYKKADAAAVKAVDAAFAALTAARKRTQQVRAEANAYAYQAVEDAIPDPDQ